LFLRYLDYKGLHPQDPAMAAPKVAQWQLSVLSKHPPGGEVQRVL
jgi:hypothetical protein